MDSLKYVKINAKDNVATTINNIKKGTKVIDNIITNTDIPQGHKISLTDIPKGGAVIRYGIIIGYAINNINMGDWVNENMLVMPAPPEIDNIKFCTRQNVNLPIAPVKTFEGYRNPKGGFAGTRNILAISTTVQCVTGVLNVAVEKIKREILPKYKNVDDVVPINHECGCGVAINAPDAVIPVRTLKNLVNNPNFGGEVMVVSLGCEKLTVDKLIKEEDISSENVIVLQEQKGFEAMIGAIVNMAEIKIKRLNERKRETLPLSELCIGMQCGGSDSFSGITSNPSAGYAADMLVQAGGTVMFSEVTEVRDGICILIEQCINKETAEKLENEMKWYDDYLNRGQVDRSANTAPGNKKGGLSNIVEKAMGSIAKSGTSPIVEVLSPGEIPTKKGLIFAATPAGDIECGSLQLASGITLQVFTTGRGSPYGLAAAPVIKVSSRTDLKEMWKDLIDLNAGAIATGDSTIEEVGTELFHLIIDVASGRKKTYTEQHKLYNDLCIFNPAPIT